MDILTYRNINSTARRKASTAEPQRHNTLSHSLSPDPVENLLLFARGCRRLSCTEGEETRHAGASKWFTSFFGGAGYRAARDTLPGSGVGEHLHRVIGVRAKSVQHRAQCMADLRLSARLLLQNRAARLVQQLVPLHDPVNFVGRRRLPGHLDVLPGQSGARHVLRRGAWNCVVENRRDQESG